MIQRPTDRKRPEVPPPSRFESEDSPITGWRVQVPGGRPLATPAFADGQLFLGGGFGSYEFYAFDAENGRMLWQYSTNDDGPTAAVVDDGFVVFNTESCELEVLTVAGQPVWKHWLGDPLMSMPAVGGGRIFMAYPDTRGDRQHQLAAFDLKTGAPIWKQPISGEILTAPVLEDDAVYFTTLDGTVYCFAQEDGSMRWKDAANATSAPVVRAGQCYYSQRKEVPREDGEPGVEQMEHCALRTAEAAARVFAGTRRKADYLDHAKRAARSPVYAAHAAYDAGVGFAAMKGDAKIEQAMRHLGQAQVSSIWGYQGSKPFISREHLFSSMGDSVHSVELSTEEVEWTKRMQEGPEGEELLDATLTPPVLVNGKVFVGSRQGELYCLSADTSEELWRVNVREPIVFPPVVIQGRAYVSTGTGSLYCLETGDEADDGWSMWGGTASHNGLHHVAVP